MPTNSELMEIIASALDEVMAYEEIAVIGWGNIDEQVPAAQAAMETLRQRIAEMEALSDAVEELARIELAYTRLPDNTWPEWDNAYDVMYAINQKVRKHD